MPGATDLPDWLDGPTRAAVRTLVEEPTSSLRVVFEEGERVIMWIRVFKVPS